MLALPGLRLLTHLPRQGLLRASRAACTAAENGGKTTGQGPQRPPFDAGLLEILVCPLSKKPLRSFLTAFALVLLSARSCLPVAAFAPVAERVGLRPLPHGFPRGNGLCSPRRRLSARMGNSSYPPFPILFPSSLELNCL